MISTSDLKRPKCLAGLCVAVVTTLVANAWLERQSTSAASRGSASSATALRAPEDSLVVPGTRVGALLLGEPEGKIAEMFPKSLVSRSLLPNCGTEYFIGILRDARHPGALNVLVKDGKIVEIEAVKDSYHTGRGTATGSSPENVRSYYENLSSYLYLGHTPEALNESRLVVWSDEKEGIAFSFVHGRQTNSKFSVYSIIIFEPGASFCVQDAVVPDAQNWRKLAPYSLESPSGIT
jgi:hypothetical protein